MTATTRRGGAPGRGPGEIGRVRDVPGKKLFLAATAAVIVPAVAAGGAVNRRLTGNINTFDGKGLSHHRPAGNPGRRAEHPAHRIRQQSHDHWIRRR
ncbi:MULTISPECIES: hypothetical protein [Streptomyces]|uniref:hypothetical protein n=1 Tax=Streptomyces TaxID=1883 RepID=UPI00331C8754